MASKLSKILFAAALVAALPTFGSAATTTVTLTKGKVQTVSSAGRRYVCGAPSSAWRPVQKVRGTKYKLISGTSAYRTVCSGLIPRGKLKSLRQLPDVGQMARANQAAVSYLKARAVSGTPPLIKAVPDLDPTTLFWRAGVVEAITGGSPTAEQCNEFWGSPVDGESSGQTACYMLQDVGRSIGTIQEAGASLCYMQSVPTSGVISSGAVTRTSGTLPSGGLARVFDVPSGSTPRLVKVNATGGFGGGSTLFIRVYSQDQLNDAGHAYRYQMWQCVDGSPTNSESTVVRLNGEFVGTNSNMQNGDTFTSTVRGYLAQSGRSIVFDSARNRTALVNGSNTGYLFKSSFTIDVNDEITSKYYEHSGDTERKAYSISHFSGSSSEDLRFLDGALKMSFDFGESTDSFQGGSEYRDTSYASSPTSDYATRVTAFDIDADSFYSSLEAPSVDLSRLDCEARPTVTLSLNMEAEAMAAVIAECESERLQGFDMCSSDAVNTAMQAYHTSCPS